MSEISPFPASHEGIFAAYLMGNERHCFDGVEYAMIWTFVTRKDAMKEQRYWESRGFFATIRSAQRGFTLYAGIKE